MSESAIDPITSSEPAGPNAAGPSSVTPDTPSAAATTTDAHRSGDAANASSRDDFDQVRDRARMQRIGGWHAAAAFAALGLFGAANWWAVGSGTVLAQFAALGNAFVAGVVMSSLFHEWGHFAGARLSGAHSPVLSKPVKFYFMFNFDMKNNSTEQFVWMSLGGILTNWALAVAALILAPWETWGGALLVAVFVGQAVNVSFFEIPVVMRARETGNPDSALKQQLENEGLQRMPGLIVGALVFLALV